MLSSYDLLLRQALGPPAKIFQPETASRDTHDHARVDSSAQSLLGATSAARRSDEVIHHDAFQSASAAVMSEFVCPPLCTLESLILFNRSTHHVILLSFMHMIRLQFKDHSSRHL